jgi:SRSO17 transposase
MKGIKSCGSLGEIENGLSKVCCGGYIDPVEYEME